MIKVDDQKTHMNFLTKVAQHDEDYLERAQELIAQNSESHQPHHEARGLALFTTLKQVWNLIEGPLKENAGYDILAHLRKRAIEGKQEFMTNLGTMRVLLAIVEQQWELPSDVGMPAIYSNDIEKLKHAEKQYGASWKKRGGVGAFMMLARKWDRILWCVESTDYKGNIRAAINNDRREEGIMDDIRDLRRYLMLVGGEIFYWAHYNLDDDGRPIQELTDEEKKVLPEEMGVTEPWREAPPTPVVQNLAFSSAKPNADPEKCEHEEDCLHSGMRGDGRFYIFCMNCGCTFTIAT